MNTYKPISLPIWTFPNSFEPRTTKMVRVWTYLNLSEPFHTYPNLFEPTQVTDMSSPLNLMVVSVLQCTVIQLWSLSELQSHAQQIFRWQLLRCLVLIGTTKSFLKQVGHYSYSSGFLWRLQKFDKKIQLIWHFLRKITIMKSLWPS